MTSNLFDAVARRRGLLLGLLLPLAGCATPPPAAPEPPIDQATRGGELYAQACAGCHGEAGEGRREGEAIVARPALSGDRSLPLEPPAGAQTRTAHFRTAKDVFDFIKTDMPPIAPGSLEDEEVWAIDAFLMKGRGKLGKVTRLDAASAASIELR